MNPQTSRYPETVEIRCPDCQRKLRSVDMGRVATRVVRRTCRCGTVWTVVISPGSVHETYRVDTLTWSRVAPRKGGC